MIPEPGGLRVKDGALVTDPNLNPTEPPQQQTLLVEGERLGTPGGVAAEILDGTKPRPPVLFLLVVSLISFVADIGTKLWAERRLESGDLEIVKGYLKLTLAKNRGGAWGLLQGQSESIRRPFFLLVSVAAIVFIMALYRKLLPKQHALKWGLPLVLGGALGNVFDRVRYGYVIDFIDAYARYGGMEHHWPTFNVADIAICVGVGLMAIDMFTSKRARPLVTSPSIPPAHSGEPSSEFLGVSADRASLTAAPSIAPSKLSEKPAPLESANAEPKGP